MTSRSSVLLQKMMQAVRVAKFGDPDVCVVSKVPIPSPGSTQVLIKSKYVGINPVDTYIRTGTYPMKPDLPYTPGADCAGIVESVGSDVTQFKAGDPVFTVRTVTGSYAEYTVAESQHTYALNIQKLSFEHGASLGTPYFTTYRALVLRAKAKAGETVFVHGASGGVGTICVQMAKHLGLRVLATAGTEEGLGIVRDCGADFTYNHRQPDYMEKIMEDTGGKGVDIILEMLANVNLQSDLQIMAQKGRTVVVGNRGSIEINPRLMMVKESVVMGCTLFGTNSDEWKEMGEAVVAAQAEGWLRPVVSTAKEYTLETASDAHRDIIGNTGSKGNIVMRVS